MKKSLIKFLTFLLCTTLCFAVACTTPDDSGSGDGESGSNPPPNERVTVEEFESKIDALQGSETVKLDAGNFGVLSFKTGVDSGQLLNGKPLYVRELNDITIEGKLDGTSKTSFLKTFKFETMQTVNDQSIMVKTTIKTLKFKDLTFNENIKLIFKRSVV